MGPLIVEQPFLLSPIPVQMFDDYLWKTMFAVISNTLGNLQSCATEERR